MMTFLVIIHVLVCVALMIVVLLQAGKGADIGATFGGGSSNTLFGSRGAGTFLTKLTAVFGTLFMLTSLGLAILSGAGMGGSVVPETPAKKAAPMPGKPGGAPFNPQPQQPTAPAPAKPAAQAPGK